MQMTGSSTMYLVVKVGNPDARALRRIVDTAFDHYNSQDAVGLRRTLRAQFKDDLAAFVKRNRGDRPCVVSLCVFPRAIAAAIMTPGNRAGVTYRNSANIYGFEARHRLMALKSLEAWPDFD